jgi:hypothetical protein
LAVPGVPAPADDVRKVCTSGACVGAHAAVARKLLLTQYIAVGDGSVLLHIAVVDIGKEDGARTVEDVKMLAKPSVRVLVDFELLNYVPEERVTGYRH